MSSGGVRALAAEDGLSEKGRHGSDDVYREDFEGNSSNVDLERVNLSWNSAEVGSQPIRSRRSASVVNVTQQ